MHKGRKAVLYWWHWVTFSEKLYLNHVYESCGLLNLGFLFTVLVSVYPSWFQIFLAFYMSLISHWDYELIRWNVDVWLLRIWKYFPSTCKTMERKLDICLRGTWIDSLTEHVNESGRRCSASGGAYPSGKITPGGCSQFSRHVRQWLYPVT